MLNLRFFKLWGSKSTRWSLVQVSPRLRMLYCILYCIHTSVVFQVHFSSNITCTHGGYYLRQAKAAGCPSLLWMAVTFLQGHSTCQHFPGAWPRKGCLGPGAGPAVRSLSPSRWPVKHRPRYCGLMLSVGSFLCRVVPCVCPCPQGKNPA